MCTEMDINSLKVRDNERLTFSERNGYEKVRFMYKNYRWEILKS